MARFSEYRADARFCGAGENLTNGVWDLQIEGLVLVVAPKESGYWKLSDVRAVKELAIQQGLNQLLKRLKELAEKPTKPSFFTRRDMGRVGIRSSLLESKKDVPR